MKKVRQWLAGQRAKFTVLSMMVCSLFCIGAFAADETTAASTLTTALTSSVQQMVTDTIGVMTALLPIVLPMIAMSIMIAYAVKFVKRIAGKA